MHDVLVEVDGVAGLEDRLLLVDPLLDSPGQHGDQLVLVGVLVEVVPEAGLEPDVHHDECLAAGVLGPCAPADAPQSTWSVVISDCFTNVLITSPRG